MERNVYKIGEKLFITSDEEIKEGDWVYYLHNSGLHKPSIHKVVKPNYSDYKPYSIHFTSGFGVQEDCKKIILTTDQDLIKDGIQAIDDEFLEWFVKNPSCEEVEVIHSFMSKQLNKPVSKLYKIIIPKEEPKFVTVNIESATGEDLGKVSYIPLPNLEYVPKQETMEEVSRKEYQDTETAFLRGVKWQSKRMYSEGDMHKLMDEYQDYLFKTDEPVKTFKEWFEQLKKK